MDPLRGGGRQRREVCVPDANPRELGRHPVVGGAPAAETALHFQGDAQGRAAMVRADSQLVNRDQDAVPTDARLGPGGGGGPLRSFKT